MSKQISFYIPRVYGDYTADDIKHTFRLLWVGEVRRVDINKTCDEYVSAFVHMDYMYDTEYSWNIINTTDKLDGCFRLNVDIDHYWLLLKNKRPVQDTHLNIHQLAENTRIMENKIKTCEEKMERMETVIHKLLITLYEGQETKYGLYNYMTYGVSYTKGYLSENKELREKQMYDMKQEKLELGELSEMEPWEDMHKYFSHLLNSGHIRFDEEYIPPSVEGSLEVTDESDDDMPSLVSHHIQEVEVEVESDDDDMPSLVSQKVVSDETSDDETSDDDETNSDEDDMPSLVSANDRY